MSPELDKKICAKYPILYSERHAPVRSASMRFGFQHDDGWYELMDCLSAKLEALNKRYPENPIVASCVKEKFGTLRFHCKFNADKDVPEEVKKELYAAEEEAVRKSCITCEKCGARGKLRIYFYWYTTLCRKCGHERCKERAAQRLERQISSQKMEEDRKAQDGRKKKQISQ